jgi:short-subunit dehydrogenase
VIHGLRTFLAEMRERNSGHIVITASVAGLTSFPGSLPYNATKHAVVSIAEGLFSEHAEAGVDVGVHCLCPGIVATNITHSERNRPKELMNVGAEDAAPAPEMKAYLDQMYANAKPSSEVAELVLAAIVEGRFWVQTDDYFRDAIKARHRAIENDQDPPARGNILSVYL